MHQIAYAGRLTILAVALSLAACNNGQHAPVTKVAGVEVPDLLPQDTGKGSPAEQMTIRTNFNKAISELRANSDNPRPFLDIVAAYLQEARIAGNDAYYNDASLRLLNRVLERETTTDDQRFYALSLKSAVLLGMQQYRQALDAAREALSLAQGNALVWGCLTDAYTELGKYDSALNTCAQMMRLRPDLRSYARVSYLREIHGDNHGAIEAMKMAAQSGVPGLEPTEWARTQLADLYLRTGMLDSARLLYEHALATRPGYAPAALGLARALAFQKKTDSAIVLAQAAVQADAEPEYMTFLANLYELKGNAVQAKQLREDAVSKLKKEDQEESKYALARQDRTRDLALAYLSLKDYGQALRMARQDYESRPANIDASGLLAWVCYLKGDYPSARAYAEKSLATHSQDAARLYKSGLIFSAAGDAARGETLKREALSIMPYLDPRLL